MHMFIMSGGRRNNCRDNEDDQNRIAEVAPHPAGAQNAHKRQKEHQGRHFKNHAESGDNGQKEVGIFADGNHGRELAAEGDKEVQRRWVNHPVAEIAACQEQTLPC